MDRYREAIGMLRAVGDLRLHGIFSGNLALLEQEQGDRASARRHFLEAVAQLEAYRDARLLGVTLGNLAALEFEEGETNRARVALERAVSLLATTGDRRSEAIAIGRLGAVLARQGNVDDAHARIVRAERLGGRADPAVRSLVGVLQAFVDLARADHAQRLGNEGARSAHMASARERVTRARAESASSDDVRTVIRTLESLLEA
jgi:tetratricopeptide (TPR) repeat protein